MWAIIYRTALRWEGYIDVKPNYVIIKKNSIHIIQPYQEVHLRIGIYVIDIHMMSIFQRRREVLPLI